MAANPLIASANVPKPGRSRYGPDWPNPVTRTTTSRGLISRMPTPTSGSTLKRQRCVGFGSDSVNFEYEAVVSRAILRLNSIRR